MQDKGRGIAEEGEEQGTSYGGVAPVGKGVEVSFWGAGTGPSATSGHSSSSP